MPTKIKKVIISIKYYGLSFIAILLTMIGFLGFVLTPYVVMLTFSFATEKYLNRTIGLSIGWLIGLLTAGILFYIIHSAFYPCLEKLRKYVKTLKTYNYAQKITEEIGNQKKF